MKLLKKLGKITLWQKLLLLGVLWLALLSVPTLFYWKEISRQIGIYRFEQQGLVPAQLLLDIMQRTQQHRSLTAAYLQEDPALKNSPLKKERRAKAEELQEVIVVLEDYSRKIKSVKIEKTLEDITADWHQISQLVTVRELSVEQNFYMHQLLMRKQLDALQMILDTYQLSRDGEPNGYYLISSSLMALPSLVEVAAQLNTAGGVVLAQGEANFSDRVDLKSLLVLGRGKLVELDSGVAKAVAVNSSATSSEARVALQDRYRQTHEQYRALMDTTQEEILSRASFSYSRDQFNAQSWQAINTYYDFMRFAIGQIDSLLKERVAAKNRAIEKFFMMLFALTGAMVFIYVYFIAKIQRQLGGEPGYAIAVVQAIGRGELGQNIIAGHRSSLLANLKIMQARLREKTKRH